MIWWREFEDHEPARFVERQLKTRFGEPPRPSPEFDDCVPQLRLSPKTIRTSYHFALNRVTT